MRSLGNTKLWCHLSIKDGERYSNAEIRRSRPLLVTSFEKLVPMVARIANHNPEFSILYRGQAKDYITRSGMSSIYPTIYRKPGASLRSSTLKKRFDKLDSLSRSLVAELEKLDVDRVDRIRKFPELQWSILQHYEVCPTPLLDLTHSLRVAASFALNAASSGRTILAVLAVPHPQGTITYSTEDELLNVRLLSACPPEALRPHFQEGYLVGSFPNRAKKKHASLDLAGRMVAKFELARSGFWSDSFQPIPEIALYPKKDVLREVCIKLRQSD